MNFNPPATIFNKAILVSGRLESAKVNKRIESKYLNMKTAEFKNSKNIITTLYNSFTLFVISILSWLNGFKTLISSIFFSSQRGKILNSLFIIISRNINNFASLKNPKIHKSKSQIKSLFTSFNKYPRPSSSRLNPSQKPDSQS